MDWTGCIHSQNTHNHGLDWCKPVWHGCVSGCWTGWGWFCAEPTPNQFATGPSYIVYIVTITTNIIMKKKKESPSEQRL
jgi:hypothetical protein